MSVAIAKEWEAGDRPPLLLHSVPGRARLHLPTWTGTDARRLEEQLGREPGVISVQANSATRNVVVRYDPAAITLPALLARAAALPGDAGGAASQERAPDHPPALNERQGGLGRARIAVRGLDRDPEIARRTVEILSSQPGVYRAVASALTGRVLVEYNAHEVALADLVAHVTSLELPDIPEDDRPAHPLDPAPLIQSTSRLIGAGLGLGLLATRRLLNLQGPPVSGAGPAEVAATISILEGLPPVRAGLRRLLGPDGSELVMGATAIASQALAGSPLGLAVSGAGALRLWTEVRARRAAWRRYEERLDHVAAAEPGLTIRVEAGERIPLEALVIEGTGTVAGTDGLPRPVGPGERVGAGARVQGGPLVIELHGGAAFEPQPRPAPAAPTLYERYVGSVGPLSLAYAGLAGLVSRSPGRAFTGLLLVSPRTAVIGREVANQSARARVLRAGVTIVGTRPERVIRRPDLLLMDSPRLLSTGYELSAAVPLDSSLEAADVLKRAAGVAMAAGAPWGSAFPAAERLVCEDGAFADGQATAWAGGVRYSLGPPLPGEHVREAERLADHGDYPLLLRRAGNEGPLGVFALRPRLHSGGADLVATCQRHGVALRIVADGDRRAARALARRAGVRLVEGADAVAVVKEWQAQGSVVAVLGDGAHAGMAFAASDLAIGLSSGRSGRFAARADLLAPDLTAVAAIVEAGARRDAAVRDAVVLGAATNVAGAAWGLGGAPGLERAGQAMSIAALASMADAWGRLRGGEITQAATTRLVDPRPERWGQRSVENVLRATESSAAGLTTAQAQARRQPTASPAAQRGILSAILAQLKSPLNGVLAVGAGFSLVLGAPADVALILAVIAANTAVGAWQEREAGQATEALARLGTVTARVLRDGEVVTLAAHEVVPGDILLLASGDRVAADARVLSAHGLEVDEAALTGESVPVAKSPAGPTPGSRIVLEGSDVTVGTARVIVVAVGRNTRMGATAAALADDDLQQSALGMRLNRMLRQLLPIAVAGGGLVAASGVLWGQPLVPQLMLGASVAIAAVPEGLPLLASVGEAAVARRLAGRRALVRRLSAVEALGRVDVACADKTGTLTEGRLAVGLIAGIGLGTGTGRTAHLPGDLAPDLRHVLLTAALASPHPKAAGVGAHPTDMAVIRAAQALGLAEAAQAERAAESPFDPARAFHAAHVDGKTCVKGAAEVLVPRSTRVLRDGAEHPLDAAGRDEVLAQARTLAERGLRILLVAEGPGETAIEHPDNLTVLGFVGISDPLRSTAPAAVARCHAAGIRVVMLTGDHPATARAIAREAGLPVDSDYHVLTGAELAELENEDLEARLEHASVIARITPLDKLRIVEALQRRGHTVAMTGDGVNDAPALRLADVGVAMGHGATEVARQAADMVLADDDLSTLVEALVEGRSFWRNIRRALGLLLGGNLGELGLLAGAGLLGLTAPLTARQILVVNLVSDILPALAVALQRPEHRNLAALSREGEAALGAPLRNDVLRRGAATALPTLVTYLIALRAGGLAQARTVAFANIVGTQLAQTLDAGRSQDGLTRSVVGAVAGSAGLMVAAITLPPLYGLLELAPPTALNWLLVGAGSLAAVPLGRALTLPAALSQTREGGGSVAFPTAAHPAH